MPDQPTEATNENKPEAAATPTPEVKPHCGIIMPISDTPGYDPGHWLQVQRLIVRAAEQAGFTATMVSENEGQDMIHASIIKNIYHNPVVVCDVSSLNPNVMLELGLRMATKKPLVLVFDSENNYPFDIKNFVYEGYPKGLHFFKIEGFVTNLASKIRQVYEAEQQGGYRPYLSHFSDVIIETSSLDTTTQTIAETLSKLVEDVSDIKSDWQSIKRIDAPTNRHIQSKIPTIKVSAEEYDHIIKVTRDYHSRFAKELSRNELQEKILQKVRYDYGRTHPGKFEAAAYMIVAGGYIEGFIKAELDRLYSE